MSWIPLLFGSASVLQTSSLGYLKSSVLGHIKTQAVTMITECNVRRTGFSSPAIPNQELLWGKILLKATSEHMGPTT